MHVSGLQFTLFQFLTVIDKFVRAMDNTLAGNN